MSRIAQAWTNKQYPPGAVPGAQYCGWRAKKLAALATSCIAWIRPVRRHTVLRCDSSGVWTYSGGGNNMFGCIPLAVVSRISAIDS